jgi:hypothetical protein
MFIYCSFKSTIEKNIALNKLKEKCSSKFTKYSPLRKQFKQKLQLLIVSTSIFMSYDNLLCVGSFLTKPIKLIWALPFFMLELTWIHQINYCRHKNKISVKLVQQCLFIYSFICNLYNDAVSGSEYKASNGRMISEWWIGRDEVGNDGDLF